MFGLGTPEIVIILVVALILFGPKKLPEIGKSIGQGIREIKKASRDVMDSIDRDDEPENK
jgi:sec-independent protein translocase protein TatA